MTTATLTECSECGAEYEANDDDYCPTCSKRSDLQSKLEEVDSDLEM